MVKNLFLIMGFCFSLPRPTSSNSALLVCYQNPNKLLFGFLDALNDVLKEEQTLDNLDQLEASLLEAMTLMERDFPCVIQVSFYKIKMIELIFLIHVAFWPY